MSSSESSGAPSISHKPSLSNLNLQVALYYNALFSILFAIVIGACSIEKLVYYNKKVSISVICLWAGIEPARLYYGFSGNLKERVPELATYLLISLFPQLPFIIYLAYIQPVKFPVDPILGSFMIAFLLVQFYCGLHTVTAQIHSQTAQFMRLCEDENEAENDDNLYDEARAAVHHRMN